jgi:hypothetical protein
VNARRAISREEAPRATPLQFFLSGFLKWGFAAESVESSAASAILSALQLSSLRWSTLRLVIVEAGPSSFRSARQQPIKLNHDSSPFNADKAASCGVDHD